MLEGLEYWVFGQQVGSRRDWRNIQKNFFDWLLRNGLHCFTAEIQQYPRVSPGGCPLTKKPEDWVRD